jgi:2,5-diketo-D-gluconate reductase A
MPLAPTTSLLHGAEIPRIGLGTWPMNDQEVEQAVAEAIEIGYRHVDTAYAYGNERGVGRGIKNSGVAREEIFVTTKLNADWHGVSEAADAWAMATQKLGVDYLDLLLIHWPNPRLDRYVQAFEGLTKLLADGRVKAIGVSNFKPEHIDRVVEATGVVPDVNQIELDPTLTRDAVRAYHAKHGIVTESYSPLGQGSGLLDDDVIEAIAERHGRTPGQAVLRWHMQLGLVTIPKSSNPERMRQNIDVFDFELSDAEMAELSGLDRGESAATDSDSFGH